MPDVAQKMLEELAWEATHDELEGLVTVHLVGVVGR
jgi:hypothetical protein